MRVDERTREVTLTEAEYHKLTANTIHGWVAKDGDFHGDGHLRFYTEKPHHLTYEDRWCLPVIDKLGLYVKGSCYKIPDDFYPNMTHKDNAIEVELIIKEV